MKEDKQAIVQESMEEFKRLFAEQKKGQEDQGKLQEELSALRSELTKRSESQAAVASSAISDEIAELKAFMMNQASRAQSEQMTRQAMLEQQQEFMQDRFTELRETIAAGQSVAASAKLDDDTQAAIKEMAAQMKTLVQISRGTEKAITEELNDKLGELREALVGTAGAELAVAEVGGSAIKSVRQMMSDLAQHIEKKNGEEKIVETLKSEIQGLRAELKDKLVAAADIKASGGGGGQAGPEVMAAMQAMQEKMFNELAAAGLMKKQVSVSEAAEVSSVMVNAAFKGMDDVEVNLGNMDTAKTVDKSGGGKKGLDALKKLKGGGAIKLPPKA